MITINCASYEKMVSFAVSLVKICRVIWLQVSTWFANARRRLKKENKMQWSPRNRTEDADDDDDDDDDVVADKNSEVDELDGGGSSTRRRHASQRSNGDDCDEIDVGGVDDGLYSLYRPPPLLSTVGTDGRTD